jgi:2'-5' RNA ligase
MRCFVAVELSERVRQELGRLVREVRSKVRDVRWVRPDRMHLTLAFLGEVAAEFVEQARPGLESAAAGHAVFEAGMGGLGAFPSSGRARVVWAGMASGADRVQALQRDVVRALQPEGFAPERRPFIPHLTLGRLRVPADVGTICSLQFVSSPFVVDQVILFRSVLRPEGPEYTALATFPLAASDT